MAVNTDLLAATRKRESILQLSQLGILATPKDLERFCDEYPWAEVNVGLDDNGREWFYIVTDREASPHTLISDVFATQDEAWRDSVIRFTTSRF